MSSLFQLSRIKRSCKASSDFRMAYADIQSKNTKTAEKGYKRASECGMWDVGMWDDEGESD